MKPRSAFVLWAQRGVLPDPARYLNEADGGRLLVPFPVADREAYKALIADAGIAARTLTAPVVEVEIASLMAIQRTVSDSRLMQYERGDVEIVPGRRAVGHGALVDVPIVVRTGGQNYLHDGHHRTTAAWLAGGDFVSARLIDLDAPLDANQT